MLPWQPYFDRCFFTILSFTVLNEKIYFHFANFYILHHLSLLMLLFNGYCSMLMVSQGFGKNKELRQVTSSNVVIGPQRKRLGTPTSPSTFSCQGFNTLGVGFNICPSLPSRRKRGRGRGARTREKNGFWEIGTRERLLQRPPFFHLRPPIFR